VGEEGRGCPRQARAGISHQEIELCFYPAQPSGPLSKIVDSARVQQTHPHCGHNDHYDKKDAKQDSAAWPTDGQPKQLSPT
jgi:hypothetical protein